jgi:hypothetical protein
MLKFWGRTQPWETAQQPGPGVPESAAGNRADPEGERTISPASAAAPCQLFLHFTRCWSVSLLQPFDCIDLSISARLLPRLVGFSGVSHQSTPACDCRHLFISVDDFPGRFFIQSSNSLITFFCAEMMLCAILRSCGSLPEASSACAMSIAPW